MVFGVAGRGEKFDMVNIGVGLIKRVPNLPRECREPLDIANSYFLAVIGAEKEPVAAPGNIARGALAARKREGDGFLGAVAYDILDAHPAIGVEGRADNPDGRVYSMRSGPKLSLVGQRRDEANRPVAAHPQVADIVEENHATDAARRMRLHNKPPHNHLRAARLVDRGAAKVVKVALKEGNTLRERATAQVGAAGDNQACGLAARVGVND